jgi:uncharacterized protein (TIGR02996 family)
VTHNDAFLEAIIENPDGDAPRLIYADWLDEHDQPERAEFIRLQCELAPLRADSPRRPELERREKQLLRAHRQEWVGPLGKLVQKCGFRRGFVEEIAANGPQFLDNAAQILRSAPVRRALLYASVDVAQLAACPELGRLQGLVLHYGVSEADDEDFLLLGACAAVLRRLEVLHATECDVSPAGLRPVLASPDLVGLRQLFLCACDFQGADGARVMADSPQLAALECFSLHSSRLDDEGAAVLRDRDPFRRLDSLFLNGCRLGDAGARALARSRYVAGLERLHLSDNRLGDGGTIALAESP